MSDNKEKVLPVMKVKCGDQLYVGKYDEERGVVILDDGRVVRVNNQPKKQETTVQQSPQMPETKNNQDSNIETAEEKRQKMLDREREKANEINKTKSDVPVDKKAEIERKKQEIHEEKNKKLIELKNKKRLKDEQKLAKKIVKKEAKQKENVAGDAGSYEPKKYKYRVILTSVLYMFVIFAIVILAGKILNSQQEEVAVIRLKQDLLSGEVIRENYIESYKMLKRSYDELGTVKYVSTNGNSSVKQIIYKWEDKDKVINKYITNYTQGGQYLTLKNVTDKKIIRNPWLAEVKEDEEIYTLPINIEGLNTRLLLPGTHLRVRVVVQMKNVPAKSNTTGDSGELFGEEGNNSGSTNNGGQNDIDKGAILSAGGTIPDATVAFDDLCAVDMLNASGESLFDIYMALSKLPVEERIKYLETTIEGNVTSFQSRVLPASLVLILTKEQATNLAEFENMTNAKIKYTILPFKDENGTLLNSFTEIADQMNDIIERNSIDK